MKKMIVCLVVAVVVAAGGGATPSHPILKPVAERWSSVAAGMEAPVVLSLPRTDQVKTASVEYATGRTMDIYYPVGFNFSKPAPVVVFVMGYSSNFTMNWFGAKLKDLGQYVSWGQLVAASGMIGVAYETDFPDDDVEAVLSYLRHNSQELGIDSARIALFACSGNTLTALGALAAKDASYRESLKCGVIFYPVISYFMNKGDQVMTAPFKRRLRSDVPVLMVTIGDERPEWKESVDTFLKEARDQSYPLQVEFYPQGIHGFDTDQDTEESKALVAQAIAFMKDKLAR